MPIRPLRSPSGLFFLVSLIPAAAFVLVTLYRIDPARRMSAGVSPNEGEIVLHAADTGDPWTNLDDARAQSFALSGSTVAVRPIAAGTARPLAMVRADFDYDAMPDLAVGYAIPRGGAVVIFRGNPDVISPMSREALDRLERHDYTGRPFLDNATAINLPFEPTLMAVGDFDDDQLIDLVATDGVGNRFWMIRGRGDGRFGRPEPLSITGRITAIAAGDLARPDGLAELVMAVTDGEASELHIFAGADGALRSPPRTGRIPASVKEFAFGDLDADGFVDLSAISDAGLILVDGADFTDSATFLTAEHRDIPFEAVSVTAGDFLGDHARELAMVSEQGRLHIWRSDGSSLVVADLSAGPGARSSANRLGVVRSRVANRSKDGIVVTDPVRGHLLVIHEGHVRHAEDVQVGVRVGDDIRLPVPAPAPIVMPVNGVLVAVRSERFDQDALDDLIVLAAGTEGRPGLMGPSVAMSRTLLDIVVDHAGNHGDGQPGDGVCNIGSTTGGTLVPNTCTLRAAIMEANQGAMTGITFSIPAITIPNGEPFTRILRSVEIDGRIGTSNRVMITTGWTGDIVGTNAMFDFRDAASGNSTLKNVEVFDLGKPPAVRFEGSSNNIVQGSYFHDLVGDAIRTFYDNGDNTASGAIQIGGPTTVPGTGLGNVISGNTASGIRFGSNLDETGVGMGGNVVQGNIIGADQTGDNPFANETGITVESHTSSGTLIGGATATARNLISGNSSEGIDVIVRQNPGSGTGLLIQGNWIGTDRTGLAALPNGNGIELLDSDHVVGGEAEGAGNVISGNLFNGIVFNHALTGPFQEDNVIRQNTVGLGSDGDSVVPNGNNGIVLARGSTRNLIVGNVISGNGSIGLFVDGTGSVVSADNEIDDNLIGLNASGTAARPNGSGGVRIEDARDTIIGQSQGNVISGNGGFGLLITGEFATGSIVTRNRIGTDGAGADAFPNSVGIRINGGASGTVIGGESSDDANTIAFNTADGVHVVSGRRNSILGNSIFMNGGIGIDLDQDGFDFSNDGVTPNDVLDADEGANDLQNAPVITSVVEGSTVVTGSLSSAPNTTYRIEFFASTDEESDGIFEGQTYLGFTNVATDAGGAAGFSETFQGSHANITATATDPEGNTSEFSVRGGIIVNSVADAADAEPGDGQCDTGATIQRGAGQEPECTLRAAIEETNAGDEREVTFDIPGTGTHVILVETLLPNIEQPVVFDATSQPGFAGTPRIEISTAASISGLTVTGGGATVRGFSIHSFAGTGLWLDGAGNNVVESNHIGTDAAGTTRLGNQRGILITNSSGNVVGGAGPKRNVISGNTFSGIQIDGAGSTGNRIEGNYIGTSGAGTTALGNSDDGVRIVAGASNNRVGGTAPGAGNVISGNGDYGVHVLGGTGNSIRGNLIGVDPSGSCALDQAQRCTVRNGFGGILVEGAALDTEIGGDESGTGNVISGNTGPGITVRGASTTGTIISGNTIGLDVSRLNPVRNFGDGILVENAREMTIGGTAAETSNHISENSLSGIHVTGGDAGDILVVGNEIGREDDIGEFFLNGLRGIRITEGASDVSIGGHGPGEANTIRGGVQVLDPATSRVRVSANAIGLPRAWVDDVDDMRLPIQLGATGPACNPWTGGSGENAGISPPRLLRLGTEFISGMARPGETVEVYRADDRGLERGRYFPRLVTPLGRTVADGDGYFTLEVTTEAGDWITATATDAGGNTSELSQLKRPVVVAPGIGGSWLRGANDDFVWLPMAVPSGAADDRLARMAMHPNGTEMENISEDGVLEFIPPPGSELPPEMDLRALNVYGEQLEKLEMSGYNGSRERWSTSSGTPAPGDSPDIDLWRFPNDWRLNQRDLADDLKERIDWITSDRPEIARSCEVDIVSHSNGGVIAATYVMAYAEHARSHVHRLLTSGTPYLGAVRAVGAHTSGYIFGLEESVRFGPFGPFDTVIGYDPEWGRMIGMARNLPATYSLMPPRTYWEASSQFEIGSTSLLEDLNGNPLPDFDATFEFMTRSKSLLGLDRNAAVWTDANVRVNDIIDDWRDWEGPPHIFRMVGAGIFTDQPIVNTVVGWYNSPRAMVQRLEAGDVRSEAGDTPLHILYRASQLPIIGQGDTTVPLSSATLGRDEQAGRTDLSGVRRSDGSDNPWIEEFEYYPCKHIDLVAASCRNDEGTAALDRTVRILESGYAVSPADNPTAKRASGLSRLPFDQNLMYVTGTARLDVHVEDDAGNHTGPVEADGLRGIVYGIPTIEYIPGPFGAVVSLSDDASYSFRIESAVGDATVQVIRLRATGEPNRETILFSDVELRAGGSIGIDLQNGVTPANEPLSADLDGDGMPETDLAPAVVLAGEGLLPAIPSPVPLRIERTVLTSDSDQDLTAQVSFSGTVVGEWTWNVTGSDEWVVPDAAGGQVPAPVELTIHAGGLEVGEHTDTLHVTLSVQAYTVTYPVLVHVSVEDQPLLSTIVVSPSNVTLAPGGSGQFQANGFDQAGQPFPFSPTWEATGGTVDQNGLYTAGLTPGVFHVTATGEAGVVAGSAIVTISDPTGLVPGSRGDTVPSDFALHQNYPNPFPSTTLIGFDVREQTHAVIRVYNLLGVHLETLVDQPVSAGRYEVAFDGAKLPAGVYWYTVEMGDFRDTRSMLIVR